MAYHVPFDFQPMTYQQALDALAGAQRLGICPLLETVVEMLDELGRPDGRYGIVQVAGTNGKTSTSRFCAAALASEGLRVALYTSPELRVMEERMEVAGHPIDPEDFAQVVAVAREAGRRVNERRVTLGQEPRDITQFDLLTVAALVAFAQAEVDVAVLEVGMGGRWDATSATNPRALAITGIALDHTRILGDTLEAIAGEKAGAIKAGQLCVVGPGCAWPPSVEEVILRQCREQGATPVAMVAEEPADAPIDCGPGAGRRLEAVECGTYHIIQRPRGLMVPLALSVETPWARHERLELFHPAFQAANVAVAVCLAEAYLGRGLEDGPLVRAIRNTPTPGRFDRVGERPLRLVDAAHNPQSIACLLATMDEMEPRVERRPDLLCAILADKDAPTMVGMLAGAFPRVHVCATDSPRAMDPGELAALFHQAGQEPVSVHGTVAEALVWLRGRDLVATGSITLAGEVARLMGSVDSVLGH